MLPLQNYITYAPASSLYASLAPSQLATVAGAGPPSGLLPNSLLVGPRQSPDLIGISPSTFVATSSAGSAPPGQAPMAGILAPAIVIGANGPGGTLPLSSSGISKSPNPVEARSAHSHAALHPSPLSPTDTMVPLTSLTQYTTAPTIRGGYIINAESVLQRPTNTPTPPSSLASGSPAHPAAQATPVTTSPLAMPPLTHVAGPGTSTLRRNKPAAAAMLHPQLSYDGTAPRTLSTGLSVSSQFYYG